MEYRKLGNTGWKVSAIAMGCWQFGGDSVWGEQEDSDSIAAVHAALDLGVNFFDTAEGYGDGRSEEVLGRALKGRRDEAIVATKAGRTEPEEFARACEDSLRRLQTDRIDLYQIHWPRRRYPLEAYLEELEKLKEAGKVGAVGVSNFGKGDLKAAYAWGRGVPVSNQLPYSLLWRAIEFEIQSVLEEHGTSIVCYSPLMQGLLSGKYRKVEDFPVNRQTTRLFASGRPNTRHDEAGQETLVFETIYAIAEVCDRSGARMAHAAIRWLLEQPAVAGVIAGARNVEQVESNAAAAARLDPEAAAELSRITDPLKRALGANPDMWNGEAKSRYR